MWRYASFCRSPFAKKKGVFFFLLTLYFASILSAVWSLNFPWDEGEDQELTEKQDDLREVEQNLSWQKEKAKKLTQQESNILNYFSRLDKTIDDYRTAVKKIQKKLKEQEAEGQKLSAKLDELEGNFNRRKRIIAQRLTGIYKVKRLGFGNIVWGSKSLTEFWRRYKLIKQIALADGKLFQELRVDYKEMTQQKAALEKNRWEITQQEAEQKKKLAPLENKLAEKKTLLSAVRREKKVYLQTIAELEEAALQMKKLVEYIPPVTDNASPPPPRR